jgi:dethiobiotin synthetase
MSVIFVTGAGTDIGKTYVACALLRAISDAGRPVLALKPVVSGVGPVGDPDFDASDTARLLRAAGVAPTPETIEACSPWRFVAPLSPDMAAAKEGRPLALADVVAWSRRQIAEADPGALVLVEGVGGVMSPIAQDGLVLDWIAALDHPALLIAGSYLGAISHALTALAALQGRGVEVSGLVVSETEGATVTLDATTAALARYVGDLPVYVMARGAQAPGALVSALSAPHAFRKTSATA